MSVATQLKKPCQSEAVRQDWRGDLEQSDARDGEGEGDKKLRIAKRIRYFPGQASVLALLLDATLRGSRTRLRCVDSLYQAVAQGARALANTLVRKILAELKR
jgi:hypothetical protein